MKILVDEMHKKAKDCYLNSYETVFGKSVLVCKLSNNECKLCKHKPFGDKKYKCESCARFCHIDHYISNT